MKLLIVFPVYNEQLVLTDSIKKTVDFCRQNFSSEDTYQVIIVDNNSSDQTGAIGRKLAEDFKEVEYLFLKDKGKGLAWRRGFELYQADFYVFMDVDLAVDLGALNDLRQAFLAGYDLVIGSRYLPTSRVTRSRQRKLISLGYGLIARLILGTKIKDLPCGFKGINNKIKINILPLIRDNGFFADTEMVIRAERGGYKIKEIPVNWSEHSELGRKSSVNLLKTICDYLSKLRQLRITLKTAERK